MRHGWLDGQDSENQADTRNDRKAMGHAGVEPGWRPRWPALAETRVFNYDAPGWHRHGSQNGGAHIAATRHREQLRDCQFDVRAAAVMLVLVRGDREQPRAVMTTGRFAVLDFRWGVLMAATQAEHGHTTNTARQGVERDDRGEQDGQESLLHS